MLASFAQSHIGQRKVNEDSFLIDEDFGLYIVADGVGGMDKGEVASQIACQVVRDSIISGNTLTESIYTAHRAIISEIKNNSSKQGMATTIVAVLFNQNSYEVAWVGDSRVYLWDGKLKLLTKDDSYVELLLENGHIGIEDLETHPDRNVISQALGIERKEISISTNAGSLEKGQMLLLSSDGLYSIANEKHIISALKVHNNVKEITEYLVNTAVYDDGKDNISLITVKSNMDSRSGLAKKPNIFREFDAVTGKIVGLSVNNITNKEVIADDANSDPELIDQTTFTDMTSDDRSLLDTAAREVLKEVQDKSYLFPIVLITIVLVIVILIAYFLI